MDEEEDFMDRRRLANTVGLEEDSDDVRSTSSPSSVVQFAGDMVNDILPKVLAELFYPAIADDCGVVNPAFSADSTAAPSPLTPQPEVVQKEQVFPDFITAERCLSNVLSDNFPRPAVGQAAKTPLSSKSSSDLLSHDSVRGLQFDLISCASAASFGRESTVAHADSTEFAIAGKKTSGTVEGNDPRVSRDFSDTDEDVLDERREDQDQERDTNTFPSGVSGIQWEEEGYPALLDLHQDDPNRIFSDEPGHFKDLPTDPPHPPDSLATQTDDVNVSPVSNTTKRKPVSDGAKEKNDNHSTTTESGPDSPETESADERPDADEVLEQIEKTGGEGLEWENDTPVSPQKHVSEQWAAAEDMAEERRWRTVVINGTKHQIDMTCVEPYRRVISHGGYYGEGLNAIAVFAACYLPSRSEPDYSYIMDNLFLYAVSMLDTLVAEDYVIIYFQGGSASDQMPAFSWLRKCYRLIDRRHVSHTEIGLDRRLRKNLKNIYLVHPTLWLRTVVTMAKPFISSKFSKKVHFIQALNDLGKLVCMDQVEIPDEVLKHDHERVFARTYTDTKVNNTTSRAVRQTDTAEGGSRRTSAQPDQATGNALAMDDLQ